MRIFWLAITLLLFGRQVLAEALPPAVATCGGSCRFISGTCATGVHYNPNVCQKARMVALQTVHVLSSMEYGDACNAEAIQIAPMCVPRCSTEADCTNPAKPICHNPGSETGVRIKAKSACPIAPTTPTAVNLLVTVELAGVTA
ncbi:hypothetical protein C8R44DRAFT_735865 [Mycena epipterygia]|nr:hypothetical protein C8R44DRAFT_735865 [Mycena epipterygia]